MAGTAATTESNSVSEQQQAEHRHRELPHNHPFAAEFDEYSSNLPDYSLSVLQKEFENRDLELLFRRYEQRARIGKHNITAHTKPLYVCHSPVN